MLDAAPQATHGRQVSGTIPSASGRTPELAGGKVLAHSPRASSEISIRFAAQNQAEYGRADHICTLMASRLKQLIPSNRMLVSGIYVIQAHRPSRNSLAFSALDWWCS